MSQDTNDGYIIFDSSSFGEGEEMHFNIKALEFSFQQVLDYVEYCYLNSETDDIATIPSSYFYKAYFTSTSYYTEDKIVMQQSILQLKKRNRNLVLQRVEIIYF